MATCVFSEINANAATTMMTTAAPRRSIFLRVSRALRRHYCMAGRWRERVVKQALMAKPGAIPLDWCRLNNWSYCLV
jgi:hypothetical protein